MENSNIKIKLHVQVFPRMKSWMFENMLNTL